MTIHPRRIIRLAATALLPLLPTASLADNQFIYNRGFYNPAPTGADLFGQCEVLLDNATVIGAPNAGPLGARGGKAYVFVPNPARPRDLPRPAPWTRRPELNGGLVPNYYPGESSVSPLYTQIGEGWRVDVSHLSFENESSFKAEVSNGNLDSMLSKTVQVITSSLTRVLPDVDGDDVVNAADLLLLKSFWHRTKFQVDPFYRPLFFEPVDHAQKRVELEHLLSLSGPDWGRQAGN